MNYTSTEEVEERIKVAIRDGLYISNDFWVLGDILWEHLMQLKPSLQYKKYSTYMKYERVNMDICFQ